MRVYPSTVPYQLFTGQRDPVLFQRFAACRLRLHSEGADMKTSNDRRRRGMGWCSQPKCVHGAEYRIKVSGRLLCKHCASLLDKAELTILKERSDADKAEETT